MKLERLNNIQWLFTAGRLTISCTQGTQQCGWHIERYTRGSYIVSWGRPRVHSRFAFAFGITVKEAV